MAGGGAAWWFLDQAPAESEASPPVPDPAFIKIPGVAVPVIQADGTIRTFLLDIALELPDEAALDAVNPLMPRITDRLLVTLHELLGRRFVADSGYDLELIKQHLIRVTREVAGETRIADVLIENFQEFRRG